MRTTDLALCVALWLALWNCGHGQEATMTAGRNSRNVTSGLNVLAEQIEDSIVDVVDSRQHLCLGTIVSSTGLIVTKASELGHRPLQCRLHDETMVNAEIIGISVANDLALLKAETKNVLDSQGNPLALKPIEFQSHVSIGQGSLVVAVDTRDNKPLLGLVTSDEKSFQIENAPCTDCPTIGIEGKQSLLPQLQIFDASRNEYRLGFIIERVLPRSIAEDCGLLKGDIVTAANTIPIQSKFDLANFEKTMIPGESIDFSVYRRSKRVSLSATIPRFSNRIYQDRWGGGPYSRRRFNFLSSILHDIPIRPEQCGSPLVDLRGNVVGINIARSLRVTSLAVPIQSVREFVVLNQPEVTLHDSGNMPNNSDQ